MASDSNATKSFLAPRQNFLLLSDYTCKSTTTRCGRLNQRLSMCLNYHRYCLFALDYTVILVQQHIIVHIFILVASFEQVLHLILGFISRLNP